MSYFLFLLYCFKGFLCHAMPLFMALGGICLLQMWKVGVVVDSILKGAASRPFLEEVWACTCNLYVVLLQKHASLRVGSLGKVACTSLCSIQRPICIRHIPSRHELLHALLFVFAAELAIRYTYTYTFYVLSPGFGLNYTYTYTC